MRRRGYITLVGTIAVAGCQSTDGGDVETTAPPATDTEAPTETPEPTPAGPATPDESGPLGDARGAIYRAHEAYVSAGGSEAQTLLDVGPATREFPTETVAAALDEAETQLTGAADSAGSDLQARIERLQAVTEWLRGAASVQDATAAVAAALEEAAQTGNFGADPGRITGHVGAAGDATDRVVSAIDGLSEPAPDAFDELSFLDGSDVVEKHEQFTTQRSGYETLGELFAATVTAGDLIDEATDAADAGDHERAEQRATTAVEELSTVLDRTEEVDHERLVPLVGRFQDALESLRNRAVAVRNNAQNSQT